MKFEEKLVKLRKQRGISQEELADELKVSRQAVSRWEQGATLPDAPNLLALSDMFGVSVDYLLHDEFESCDNLPKVVEAEQANSKKKKVHKNLVLAAAILWLAAAIFNLATAIINLSILFVVLCFVNVALSAIFFVRFYKLSSDK